MTANQAFELFHEGVDPSLQVPPANVFRLAVHPDGVARRVRNLAEWSPHFTENLRAQLRRSPNSALDVLLAELEAFLPADDHIADVVRRRWG